MNRDWRSTLFLGLLALALPPLWAQDAPAELEGNSPLWRKEGADLVGAAGQKWSAAFVRGDVPVDAAIEAEILLEKPCPRKGKAPAGDWFRYTVQRNDPGYEACLILRSFGSGLTESWWYRVQISSAYQEVALHKGNGGYVRIVPAEVPVGKPILLKAEARGTRIRAWLNGALVIDFEDRVAPIQAPGGKWGVGTFETPVRFRSIRCGAASSDPLPPAPEPKHAMSVRTWHDDLWIFSDDEPIARFVADKLTEMKLAPGYQGQLLAALCWEESSQQPSKVSEVKPRPAPAGAAEVVIDVRGRTVNPAAEIKTVVRAGYDRAKGFYYYDLDSTAALDFGATPQAHEFAFTFIMPYSLSPNAWGNWTWAPERHLDLMPPAIPDTIIRSDDAAYYHWEFFRGQDGIRYRVPIRIDWDRDQPESFRTRLYTGPSSSLKPDLRKGERWIRGPHPVANPCVTFLEDEPSGEASCAVCCFSHESHIGWAFSREKLKNSELRAHYRYSAVSPSEMARLMLIYRLPSNPVLKRLRILHKPGLNRFGPDQQNSVADPLVCLPWNGAYDVDQKIGYDDTSSIVLEGGGWAEWKPLRENGYGPGVHPVGYDPAPRTLIRLAYRTLGVTGRGVYLEVTRDQAKERHYFGSAPPGKWDSGGLVTGLLAEKGNVTFRIGLDGGGRAWVDNVEVRTLRADEAVPEGVSGKASSDIPLPARLKTLPAGAVSVWALDETLGTLAYDWVGGRPLELRNPLWAEADGRRGLRLSPQFEVANGTAQGNFDSPERTVAFWFRPDEVPGRAAYWGISVLSMQRRLALTLSKEGKPGVLLELADKGKFLSASQGAAGDRSLVGTKPLAPNKWQHIATVVTMGEGKMGAVALYVNGEIVAEGRFSGEIAPGASAITLGSDPHETSQSRAWGMFSDVQCYGRALTREEVRTLAQAR